MAKKVQTPKFVLF